MDLPRLEQQAYAAYRANDFPSATRLCQEILGRSPQHAAAIYLLGVILNDAKRIAEAIPYFEQAVSAAPTQPVYVNALGEALLAMGKAFEAQQQFERATQVGPTYARAYNNLGRLLHAKGELGNAEKAFSRAVALNPSYAIAHNNLGAIYQAIDNPDAARPHFERALALQPAYPEAYFNLATLWHRQGNWMKAIGHLQQAIRLRPAYAKAHTLLGRSLLEIGQVAAAVDPLETASRLTPRDPIPLVQLGEVLLLLGEYPRARQAFDQALLADPADARAFASRHRLRQHLCEWDDPATAALALDRLWSDAQADIAAGRATAVQPLHACALPWSPAQLLRVAATHAQRHDRTANAANLQSAKPAAPSSPSSPDRLRIGYISRDLYDHPVGHQIQGLFRNHDRARFEVHVYSYGPNDASIYRQGVEQHAEHFHDAAEWTLDRLDAQIRVDRIDILVDLMGHTGLSRLPLYARRPAPIQVTWLGYPGTTGADYIDYLIADDTVAPAGESACYSEKVVRLASTFFITDDTQPISSTTPTRAQQNLPPEAFVFICFNNAYKIDRALFERWMTILRQVPRGVLWLSVREPATQENLRQTARRGEIDPGRVIFAARAAQKADHLARLRLADLYLDTPIYNAHATACDVLWAGVPMLTTSGPAFAGRVAASLLNAAGLPDLVLANLDAYARRAVELANDPAQLAAIRQRVSDARAGSFLFNTLGFVRRLENAFEQMAQLHQAGTPPRDLTIA